MSGTHGQLRFERCSVPSADLSHDLQELSIRIWGTSERDALPAWKIMVTPRIGGELAVAFADERPVGLALCTFAERAGVPYLYLDMIGVEASTQGSGIGASLMQVVVDAARQRGLGCVEWTFDPLEGANANLYLRKLGGVGVHFYANYYGQLSGERQRTGPTDRLLVRLTIDGVRPQANRPLPRTVVSIESGLEPGWGDSAPSPIGLAFPVAFAELLHRDPEAGAGVRARSAECLERLVNEQGFSVTGFVRGESRNVYVLEKQAS